MEDRQIVDLFWERSESAISETHRKYRKYCMYIAGNILRNTQDAEECVSDAYNRLWNLIPPARPEKLSAFLGKLVRGFAVDRMRMSGALKRGNGDTETAYEELSECFCVPDPSDDAENSVRIRDALNGFLSELGKETRVIFIQRYWYMCSVREISRELGIGESKVKTALFRARNDLKKYLEKEGVYL